MSEQAPSNLLSSEDAVSLLRKHEGYVLTHLNAQRLIFLIESLQRRLDAREELVDGYEKQLGIDEADVTITVGSEIERLLELEKRATAEPPAAQDMQCWVEGSKFKWTTDGGGERDATPGEVVMWAEIERLRAAQPPPAVCPTCRGNDREMPCAYPSEGKPGCLRASSPPRARPLSASERLHNICDALSEQADESPFTREEWERVDKQTVALQKSLREAIDLAEIGDITEETEAHGWGAWLKEARSVLGSSPTKPESPNDQAELCEDCPPRGHSTDRTRCTECPRLGEEVR